MTESPPLSVDIDIIIEDARWQTVDTNTDLMIDALYEDTVQKIFKQLPQLSKDIPPGCSILLTSDEAIRTLNHDFRDKDVATDVLSFPAEQRAPETADLAFSADYLGDIALAFETLDSDAKKNNINFYSHSVHLLTHSILHLLGYNHETEGDAAIMEKKERNILMEAFGIADPYGKHL